jgi:hypothetical protein
MFWENFKKLLTFAVVNSLIICDFQVSINRVSGSCMDVMNGSLWHAIQYLKELTSFHDLFVFEVIMNGTIKVFIVRDLLSVFFYNLIRLSFLIS